MFCIRLHAGFSILTTLTERTWLMNHSGTRLVLATLTRLWYAYPKGNENFVLVMQRPGDRRDRRVGPARF